MDWCCSYVFCITSRQSTPHCVENSKMRTEMRDDASRNRDSPQFLQFKVGETIRKIKRLVLIDRDDVRQSNKRR